jgi:23S rRNA G2445 N2-methylase RlmL
MREAPRWSFFLLTSDKGLEKALRRRAERRRKLFNGNIETTYYQYHGEK